MLYVPLTAIHAHPLAVVLGLVPKPRPASEDVSVRPLVTTVTP